MRLAPNHGAVGASRNTRPSGNPPKETQVRKHWAAGLPWRIPTDPLPCRHGRVPDIPPLRRPRRRRRLHETCTLCHKARGRKYVLDDYGIPEPNRECLCPWCIADGTAAAKGMKFNIAKLRPEMRLRAEPTQTTSPPPQSSAPRPSRGWSRSARRPSFRPMMPPRSRAAHPDSPPGKASPGTCAAAEPAATSAPPASRS